jgi:hypothetical protein
MYHSAVGWTELVESHVAFVLVVSSFQCIIPETLILIR